MAQQISPPEQQAPAAVSRDFRSGEPNNERLDYFCLLDLLSLLAERKRLIFTVTAGFAVASIIVSLLLPPRYTATVTLLPPRQNFSLASLLGSQMGSLGEMAALAGGSLGLKSPNDMYVGMLRSRTVEDSLVQSFGLMKEYHDRYLSNARKDFERNSVVDGDNKDGLIHISVVDRNPVRAAQLANGYVDQFRALSAHLAITEASRRRLFFDQQLEQAKDNLANAEAAFVATEQKTGLIQLDSQARALIETATSLRAQITALEVQIQGMQTYATGQNAQYVQAEKELDALRSQLAKLGGSEDPSNASLIVPKGMVPEAGLEYIRKQRDVKYYQAVFDFIEKQDEIAKLDEAKEGPIVQVVDHAIPPEKRSSPKRGMIVIVCTACGFFIGILLALFKAEMNRLKQAPESSLKLARLRHSLSLRHGVRE